MKAILVAFALAVLCSPALLGAEGVAVAADDSIGSFLKKHTGQVVEIRLKSGDKIAGKVATVGVTVLHLSQLTGQDFFDAVIDVKDVSAVIVRARQK
jgi:hypothetical protein